MLELTDGLKALLKETAERLKGHERRRFMAQTVEELGIGGQRLDAKATVIRLAYYPPYHSKYNPIERTWGILENHWNGSILDEIDTVLNFARTMTWKGQNPVVKLVTEIYKTGVKLTKQAMAEGVAGDPPRVENQIQRLTCLEVQDEQLNLGKWFVDIVYNPELKLE